MSNTVNKNAVVGDGHAGKIFSAYSSGTPGLPLCSFQLDDEVKNLIKDENYDRIYISPSYPLAGLKKIEEIQSKYANPEETIFFEKEEMGFFHNTYWTGFVGDKEAALLLWAYWQNKLKYLYELSEKIWILPLALYWYEMKIQADIPRIYSDVVQDFPRCVDVAAILNKNRFYHQNKFGGLTDKAIALISQAI